MLPRRILEARSCGPAPPSPISARTTYENGVRRSLDKTPIRSLSSSSRLRIGVLAKGDEMSSTTTTEAIWFIDNLARVLVDGDASGGTLAVVEVEGRRGDMPPLHVHRREDEVFYVL